VLLFCGRHLFWLQRGICYEEFTLLRISPLPQCISISLLSQLAFLHCIRVRFSVLNLKHSPFLYPTFSFPIEKHLFLKELSHSSSLFTWAGLFEAIRLATVAFCSTYSEAPAYQKSEQCGTDETQSGLIPQHSAATDSIPWG
jgi:hypothetical protein